MYEYDTDDLSNNLWLNEIFILIIFQFYCKINWNQLKIVAETTYGLNPHQYFEIFNLNFWRKSLVTKRFGFHSDSRSTDEIKDLLILIDFKTLKHGVVTPV